MIKEVCGCKDDVGVFHDTLQGAQDANLVREITNAVNSEYCDECSYILHLPPSRYAIKYIVKNYNLSPKESKTQCKCNE